MELAQQIRNKLNPHPAGQMEKNVPELDGERVEAFNQIQRNRVILSSTRTILSLLLYFLLPLGAVCW